jgi:hypothetical protein
VDVKINCFDFFNFFNFLYRSFFCAHKERTKKKFYRQFLWRAPPSIIALSCSPRFSPLRQFCQGGSEVKIWSWIKIRFFALGLRRSRNSDSDSGLDRSAVDSLGVLGALAVQQLLLPAPAILPGVGRGQDLVLRIRIRIRTRIRGLIGLQQTRIHEHDNRSAFAALITAEVQGLELGLSDWDSRKVLLAG